MAYPVVVFNSSTGSDTAASGAGPATAVTGTAAAHTNGSASTTITLTNSPDLSGVATDGSHVLWMDTPSGRQFSKITGVDNGADTVTVEDSFNIASGSAVNYAIGGKRATFDNADSRTLFGGTTGIGFKAGWTIRTETDQSITSSINITVTATTALWAFVEGDSESTHRLITSNANSPTFNGDNVCAFVEFRNLKAENTHVTKNNSWFYYGRTGPNSFRNCIIGHATNTLFRAIERSSSHSGWEIVDCEVKYCVDSPFAAAAKQSVFAFHGCSVHDNGGIGCPVGEFGTIEGCLIYDNTGDGISVSLPDVPNNPNRHIVGNVIHSNGGDGIDSSSGAISLNVYNNNVTSNGGYGWRAHANQSREFGFADFNNYGTGGLANTSGALLNVSAGANDLAVDPGYTDASNGNFECGTAVKALGFPKSTRTIGANQSATNAFVDVGIQREEAGGSTTTAHIIGG